MNSAAAMSARSLISLAVNFSKLPVAVLVLRGGKDIV